ncbi:fumarylacetoacetate hydrolase [Haematococcus lacustris]|uniref:Fumarylacetoacetase n=1 Tax=Haematococcus lacustris TaxID=44745 RepID=A0A699YN30_HAELA|nr:fumarylacetoacetate hydrolase [Haematococcus lacustris]
MALGPACWAEARQRLQRLLGGAEGALRDNSQLQRSVLHPEAEVAMQLPAIIGDYTDFYASRQHATNVGALFRGPGNELQPNWLHLPVGYHGRASSIFASASSRDNTWVTRPIVQQAGEQAMFGLVLLNDWSARDIQAWEYVPLGPFNGKNWISPWVITLDALQPFLTPAPPQDPPMLPYLHDPQRLTYDVSLSVDILPKNGHTAARVTTSNLKHL